MGLAHMVGLDEGALICDFAETYHVLDWRALPVRTAATLAMGLGPESRIMREMSGVDQPINTLLLATIADALHILAWQNTKDGARGRNKPVLITESLISEKKETESSGFETVEDFRAWRESMLRGE